MAFKSDKQRKKVMSELKGSVDVPKVYSKNKLLARYKANEEINNHSENTVLLAKNFGTKEELKKAEKINNRGMRGLTESESKFQYKIDSKYYKKLLGENK